MWGLIFTVLYMCTWSQYTQLKLRLFYELLIATCMLIGYPNLSLFVGMAYSCTYDCFHAKIFPLAFPLKCIGTLYIEISWRKVFSKNIHFICYIFYVNTVTLSAQIYIVLLSGTERISFSYIPLLCIAIDLFKTYVIYEDQVALKRTWLCYTDLLHIPFRFFLQVGYLWE